ncbi:hypothetical protein PDESU_00860 [Pontiella desulfatans]|uniref:Uncharacterized protein n=1 Tax=Pontiella desulfatans TaxID=2750659 RepID=A0A6C2TXE2_PONDE|nr:hypothetical protein PDESU_00860 [Pontiella desulfatans]
MSTPKTQYFAAMPDRHDLRDIGKTCKPDTVRCHLI